jgi:amino acid permease
MLVGVFILSLSSLIGIIIISLQLDIFVNKNSLLSVFALIVLFSTIFTGYKLLKYDYNIIQYKEIENNLNDEEKNTQIETIEDFEYQRIERNNKNNVKNIE